jgi:serine/threonine-protein kinase HipA
LPSSTRSLDLVEGAAGYFGLGLPQARAVIREVAAAVATWGAVAKEVGARPAEIARMSSAFEHDELARALAL